MLFLIKFFLNINIQNYFLTQTSLFFELIKKIIDRLIKKIYFYSNNFFSIESIYGLKIFSHRFHFNAVLNFS
jgi:hypothetical protein